MSEMMPLDAGFDLSIRDFGQASGRVRARPGSSRRVSDAARQAAVTVVIF